MNAPAHGRLAALLLAAASVAAGAAHAQASVDATATIGTAAAYGANGAVTVNEAAGIDSAQSNQITITNGGGVANLNLNDQSAAGSARVSAARATIGANAFANTTGAVMVNQSAGAGNVQSNSAQIGTAAIGVETVSDSVLSAAAATNSGHGQSAEAHGIREASIDSTAFRNATGLVQINQAAGAGNATANSFVLRPPAGTLF